MSSYVIICHHTCHLLSFVIDILIFIKMTVLYFDYNVLAYKIRRKSKQKTTRKEASKKNLKCGVQYYLKFKIKKIVLCFALLALLSFVRRVCTVVTRSTIFPPCATLDSSFARVMPLFEN